MTENQLGEQLTNKLTGLGYDSFEVLPEENTPLLYIGGHLICSVSYALDMSDDMLRELIVGALEVQEDGL